MPANRFNGFTEYGIGIGLRIPYYQHILEEKPVVDCFEIISENYMIDGGCPLAVLDQILEQYKLSSAAPGLPGSPYGLGDTSRNGNLRTLRIGQPSIPCRRRATLASLQ
jgi:hypothetical protein